MADATGLGAKMGMKVVADWDTAFSAVDIPIPFISETLSTNFDRIEDDSLVGSASRGPSLQGNEVAQGDTFHNLDYNNFDSMIKAAFGAAAGRVFTVSDDDVPEYRYLEVDRVVERFRYGPMKASKIVLAGQAGQFVTLAESWAVKTRARSATAHPSLAYLARKLVRFSDLTFQIGDLNDALAGGDIYGINNFEFTLDRTMKVDDYDSESNKQILVPIPNNYRNTMIKVGFSRYNTQTSQMVTWKEADEPLQVSLLFSLAGETFKIELPNVRITEGFEPNVSGPGVLPIEGVMSCHPSLAGNPMYVGNEARITFT